MLLITGRGHNIVNTEHVVSYFIKDKEQIRSADIDDLEYNDQRYKYGIYVITVNDDVYCVDIYTDLESAENALANLLILMSLNSESVISINDKRTVDGTFRNVT